MESITLKQATTDETETIQWVYDYLNEKCAFDYANSVGITDWQYCYYCSGKTPTNENNITCFAELANNMLFMEHRIESASPNTHDLLLLL